MRMAKLQKATLDPSKISGHCGRLKCCLRYEDETYQHLRNNLPRKNTLVSTPHGQGRVIDGQVLTQLVLVVDEQGTEFAVPLADVTVISEQGGDNRTQAPRPQVTRPEPKIEEPAAAEEPVEDTQPEEPQQSLDDQQPLDNEEEAENPEENK